MAVLQHALVAGEAFFENEYLSIGLSAFGSVGTSGLAPAGYANKSGNLGLYGYGVNEVALDAVSSTSNGDGFSVAHDGTNYTNNSRGIFAVTQIAGTMADKSTATLDKAVFTSAAGAAGGLQVVQTTTLSPTDHATTVKVTLKNTTGTVMHNVGYEKVADPNLLLQVNDTLNVVFAQDAVKNLHGVAGYSPDDPGVSPVAYFLYAKDSHASVSFDSFGFNPSGTLAPEAQGAALDADMAEHLLFKFGDLAPGASVSFTYYEGVTDSLPEQITMLGKQPLLGTDTIDWYVNPPLDYSTSPTKVYVDGLQGDDYIVGSPYGDVIQGGRGNDIIYGGAGNDVLMGGDGADAIIADRSDGAVAPGQDIMYGGAGGDTFYVTNAADTPVSKPDMIMDFSQGDAIDLYNMELSSGVSFTLTSGFTHHAGQLIEVAKTGGYLIEGDLNGDAKADFAIFVASHTGPLPAGDFIL